MNSLSTSLCLLLVLSASLRAMNLPFVITNGTYEPIIIEIFNETKGRYERKALEAHQKVAMTCRLSSRIALMLEASQAGDRILDDCVENIYVPEEKCLPYLHAIRNRSTLSGLACYFAKISIVELRKQLLAEKCALAKKQKHVHWADDEKTGE